MEEVHVSPFEIQKLNMRKLHVLGNQLSLIVRIIHIQMKEILINEKEIWLSTRDINLGSFAVLCRLKAYITLEIEISSHIFFF